MLFSSIPFLYCFLPVFLFFYYLVPAKFKNAVILFFSLVFYGWGESRYVFLMMAVILTGYLYGLLLERYREKRSGKLIMAASVLTYLLILGYFKYADFFLQNLRDIFSMEVSLLNIALPIGISFYIFQILSYNIDVYRGQVRAQKNIVYLGTYVAMFPQLIAGPIVRYQDIEKQLIKRECSVDRIYQGIVRFTLGLSKKILIANILGECLSLFKAREQQDVLFYWLYGVCFMLHIYFDFSGYSDMAIGLGKLLGFELMENFRYPYMAKSITEFWRRWHISLGTWFRDYVYIPLGGNRVSGLLWIRNIFLVWLLTGFWHGAAWNFIIWGLYFAAFLLAEKLLFARYVAKSGIISHLYLLFFIMLSFIIFDSADLSQAGKNIGGLFGIGAKGLYSEESIYYAKSYFVTIIAAVIGATPLPAKAMAALKAGRLMPVWEILVLVILLLTCTAYLVDGSFNPFLYFRF